MEKIIVNPEKIRGLGNVIDLRSRSDYLGNGVVQQVSTESINNISFPTYKMIRTNTTISASNVSSYVGSAYLAVSLSTNGTMLDDKLLTLLINGQVLSATTDGGYAYFDLTSIPEGNYKNCLVSFDGDAGATAASTAVNINIMRTPTSLTLSPSSSNVLVGDNVTFTVTLTSGGTGLAEQEVYLYCDGGLVGTLTTNSSGVATYTENMSSVWLGTTNWSIVYDGTNIYDSNSDEVIVTVGKLTPTLTLTATSPVMEGSSGNTVFSCTYNNESIRGNFEVYIDNEYASSWVNFLANNASLDMSSLREGTHTIMVKYLGDATHNEVSRSVNVTVIDYSMYLTNFNITGTQVVGNASDNYCIAPNNGGLCSYDVTGKVVFANGTPVEGISVEIKQGTLTYTAETNSSGVFTYSGAGFGAGLKERDITVNILAEGEFKGKTYEEIAHVIASNADFDCEDAIA